MPGFYLFFFCNKENDINNLVLTVMKRYTSYK